jgi:hypothetical protein
MQTQVVSFRFGPHELQQPLELNGRALPTADSLTDVGNLECPIDRPQILQGEDAGLLDGALDAEQFVRR